MKKIKNFLAVFFLSALISGLFFYFPTSAEDQASANFTQEDIVNLIKPAVVRIIQHTQGKIIVYPFDLDLKNLRFFGVDGNPLVQELEAGRGVYMTGSGAVINPNGYILTNSHVISFNMLKYSVAESLARQIILAKSVQMTQEEQDEFSKKKDLEKFFMDFIGFIMSKIKLDVQKKLYVINPSVKSDNIEESIKNGFPAKVVSVNDDFWKDFKDAGVVKIDQENLPSVSFGDSDQEKIGEKIYVFGFPGSADFNDKSMEESTFTQGALSALKDTDNKEFKIFQTDAKISQGSSGGPLVNSSGEVIGLITYQTSQEAQSKGDTFAFAIPINKVKEIIESNPYKASNFSSPDAGNFYPKFKSGIELMQSSHCKQSIEEFKKAKENLNQNFTKDIKSDFYIEKCNKLVSSGDSVDSSWDEWKLKFKETKYSIWVISGAAALVVIFLSLLVFFMRRKIKCEEKEIGALEENIKQEKQDINILEKDLEEKEKEIGILEQNLEEHLGKNIMMPSEMKSENQSDKKYDLPIDNPFNNEDKNQQQKEIIEENNQPPSAPLVEKKTGFLEKMGIGKNLLKGKLFSSKASGSSKITFNDSDKKEGIKK